MAVHDGHRDRMRTRIESSGIDALQPHEALEYLLYAFIPRKDTNELAHRLIAEFGNFANVCDADIDRLASVKGMTYNAALFLHNLPAVNRIYSGSKEVSRPILKTTAKCVEYITPYLKNLKKEEVRVLLKDSAGRLIKNEVISKGSISEAHVYAREIADLALKHGASTVVLAHNHPSGNATPSNSDIAFTEQLAVALNLLSIRLDDHIIIADGGYYSCRTHGDLDRVANSNILFVNGKIGDIRY